MAPLILNLQMVLACNISEFTEVKIIPVQFTDTALDKMTSTYDSTDCIFQISTDFKEKHSSVRPRDGSQVQISVPGDISANKVDQEIPT